MMRWTQLRLRAMDRQGIVFGYRGDEVVWLWCGLWQGRAWLSIGFEGRFASLEALDNEWDAYFDAMRQ